MNMRHIMPPVKEIKATGVKVPGDNPSCRAINRPFNAIIPTVIFGKSIKHPVR